MMDDEIGRRRPAKYEAGHGGDGEILFVTLATKDRKMILARDDIQALLAELWQNATAWLVGRYVLMPDHLHFFCACGGGTHSLEAWMQFWKAAATRNWPRLNEKPVWQRAYWDTRLRSGDNYSLKWDYVRENPVRAGLVAHADAWRFQGEIHFLQG